MGCSSSSNHITKYHQIGLNGLLLTESESSEFLTQISSIPQAFGPLISPDEEIKLLSVLKALIPFFEDWKKYIIETYSSIKNNLSSQIKTMDQKLTIAGTSILIMGMISAGNSDKIFEFQDLIRKNSRHSFLTKPLFTKGKGLIELLFSMGRKILEINQKITSFELIIHKTFSLWKDFLEKPTKDQLESMKTLLDCNFQPSKIKSFVEDRAGVMMTGIIYYQSQYNMHKVNSSVELIWERLVGGDYASEEICEFLKEWIKKDQDLFWIYAKKLKNDKVPAEWRGFKAYFNRVEDVNF